MSQTNDAKVQIQSQDGLWASCYDFFLDKPAQFMGSAWVCQDFVAKIAKAASSAPEGSELARCSAAMSRVVAMKLMKTEAVVLPLGPEEAAAFDAKRPALVAAIKKDPRRHGIYYGDSDGARFAAAVDEAVARKLEEASPKKNQKWIAFPPNYAFQADPGKAAMVNSEAAEAAMGMCKALVEIAATLAKATAQAKAAGAEFEPWEVPSRKLAKAGLQMAGAKAVPFVAAEVYASRSCFAIYVGQGSSSGFESTRKDVKPDLGSARLFPTEAMAKRYAKASYGGSNCAIVAVDIAPVSFSPMGNASGFDELRAVIAAKEALELDAAIKGARIEALEAELASRRAVAPPPASKGRL